MQRGYWTRSRRFKNRLVSSSQYVLEQKADQAVAEKNAVELAPPIMVKKVEGMFCLSSRYRSSLTLQLSPMQRSRLSRGTSSQRWRKSDLHLRNVSLSLPSLIHCLTRLRTGHLLVDWLSPLLQSRLSLLRRRR